MKKNIDFLAVGDIVIDNFIELKQAHLDPEANELCVKFAQKIPYENAVEVRAVGNSANAAVGAARLGLKSALITSVGDDRNGKDCIAVLKKEKVNTKFVNIDKEGNKTNYHFVLRYGAERTILIKHAPFKYVLPKNGKGIKWVYFSSVGEHAIDFHTELVEWLKENPETKLAFQPGTFQIKLGPEKLKHVYQKTELFFCNKEEAQAILNTQEDDIKELLKGMHTLGPKMVVITDGPKGLMGSDGENSYFLPMYPDPKDPVDRTGAGDATSSTITAMLSYGKEFHEALKYGPVNSMSVVQEIGAQKGLLVKEKLEEYFESAPSEYEVKKV
ncbi:MAG: carbohydrate kinase family protein [Patescibacteria group bacterium]|nr:carbohydrate kinase family protein [Patescibacteria group bacterium]